MAEATSELSFLIRREKVPDDVVKTLVEAGVTTMKTFANLAADADGDAEDDLG